MNRTAPVLVFVFCVAASIATAVAAERKSVQGRAQVISGDTLVVAGQRIRLFGIDAPELGQKCRWPNKEIDCGNIGRTALLDLIAPVDVICRRRRMEKDGTWIATCLAEGFDVGTNMVYTGWAVALPGDPAGLAGVQAKSKSRKRGMWKGTFQMPWEWRKRP